MEVGCRSGGMAAVRHLAKVERWSDRMAVVRYPGGSEVSAGWNGGCETSG